MVYDPLLATTVFMLFVAVVATYIFHKRIRRVSQEYVKAKNIVEDVILSFDRQIEQQEQELSSLAYKTEALLPKDDGFKKRIETQENQLNRIAVDLQHCSTQIIEVNKEIKILGIAQKKISDRVDEIEKMKSTPIEAPSGIAFPIKRDKAIAPLTETELRVLEILSIEGAKTSPEIKSKVNLAREHIARLMKKLYEGGYIERNTQKLPYKYLIKEEMRDLLKKAEIKN